MADAPEMFSTRQQRKGSAASNKGLIALMVAAAVLVALCAAGWWAVTRTEKSVAAGKQVEVRIPQGAGTEQIARMLSSYGIVNNSLMLQIKAKLSQKPLKAGTYQFATGMPDDLVLERLAAGPQIVYYDVLIPEGFTAKQVAKRFAARAGVSEDEMMALVTSGAPQFEAKHPYLKDAYGGSLEGYLFPATYRIKKGTKPEAIVEMMLEKFDVVVPTIDLTYAQSKNLTLNDVVIIASILEREASLAKDYPTVASVIYNRLHAKMRLQLDSTVLYVSPPGTERLSSKDLFNPSPYNTYRRAGLPPGPLCNPGVKALTAAARPSETKYLYYVLTSKDGSQTFAVTYAEFLVAKKKFKQVFGY
jgi:UPF0755 protein